MKTYFVFSLLAIAIISNGLYAQDYDKVYFNAQWIVVPIDSAMYYRTSDFNPNLPAYKGTVTDYYLKNNQVEMTGQYVDGVKDGEFTFYYSNGTLKMRINFSKNNRTGTWQEFHENGTLKAEAYYKGEVEQLIALNDSTGKSIIKGDNFSYSLQYFDAPQSIVDINNLGKDETIEVSGTVVQNLREGKWKIKKKGEQYASLTYESGILKKGYYIVNNQKIPLSYNLAFPIIVEPRKFNITENFVLKPGTIIKNNYVTEGLHQYTYKSMKKITITNYDELVEYINEHFVVRTKKSVENIKISIEINNGLISKFTTEPQMTTVQEKDLKLLLDTIERISFVTNDTVVVYYTIEFEKEIGRD